MTGPSKGYRNPLHEPATDTEPADYRCITLQIPDDAEYLAAFKRGLESLSHWPDYRRTGDTSGADTARVWKSVLDSVVWDNDSCYPEQGDEGGCFSIGPFHPAVSYYPNHPKLQPNYAGPYDARVWTTGAGYSFATADDVMLDSLSWVTADIIEAIAIGLPSITVGFTGAGEIDIHFISQLQGGAVWVFPDGNPLVGDLVSTEFIDVTDIASIETLINFLELALQGDYQQAEAIHTMNFETGGEHTITMWFLPLGEIEPPYVGLGGGLREIQFCGEITVIEEAVVPYTIELDGDSLNLLADDVVVSEISKTTLQSFLDKWVDEAGDTMTGELVHDIVSSGGSPAAETWKRDGEEHVAWIMANGLPTLRAKRNLRIRNESQGTSNPSQIELRNDGKIRLWANANASLPPNAWVAMANRHATEPTVGISNSLSGGPLLWAYDHIPVLRASLIASGKWRGAGLDGYDYSSTSIWRKQFGLQGAWKSSVDATYKGRVELDVSGYDGDHEVFAAEYGESISDLPAIGFFGDTPQTRVPFSVAGINGLTFAMYDQLKAYGLLDAAFIPPSVTPEAVSGDLTAWEKCNAAYYAASQLDGLIQDIVTNIETVTFDELLSGVMEDYGLVIDGATQMLNSFMQQYGSLAGVLTDWSDRDDFTEELIACDFDLTCFLEWLLDYPGWTTATKDIIRDILTAVWDTLMPVWMGLGKWVDSGECNDATSCKAEYDFRWSTHGWQITNGVWEHLEGFTSETVGGVGQVIDVYLDLPEGCPFTDIYALACYDSGEGTGTNNIIFYVRQESEGAWVSIDTFSGAVCPSTTERNVDTADPAETIYGMRMRNVSTAPATRIRKVRVENEE